VPTEPLPLPAMVQPLIYLARKTVPL